MRLVFFALIVMAVGVHLPSALAEPVVFPGPEDDGRPVDLKGELVKPSGDGPFPAVVLLHGGDGPTPHLNAWAARFVEWGYWALIIDSFGPRGIQDIHGDPFVVNFEARADDAYAAKAYLTAMPRVEKHKIAIIGWGHGGRSVMKALFPNPFKNRGAPFCAGVAFYPFCMESLDGLNAPFLILTGELDDWHPAEACLRAKPEKATKHEVVVKLYLYPGAYNGFDEEGVNKDIQGHHYEYHPEAAADAVIQVKQFLERHMQ